MQARIPAAIAVCATLVSGPAMAASGLALLQNVGGLDIPPMRSADGLVVKPLNIYVASSDNSTVLALFRNPLDGKVSLINSVTSLSDDGLHRASALAMSPDEAYLYVGSQSSSDDLIGVYTEGLAFVETEPTIGRIDDLAVSPDGGNLYAVSRLEDALEVFTRDVGTGELSPLQLFIDGSGVDGLNGATGVVVSPDGKHVYVTGEIDDAVAVFSRDGITGALTFVTSYTDGLVLRDAHDVAISPDGMHLYVAPDNLSVGGPTVYSRDSVAGLLTFVEAGPTSGETVAFTRGTGAVAVSDDGNFVVGGARSSVVLYGRNTSTGALTFIGAEQQRNMRVGISVDNRFVYSASGSNDLGIHRVRSLACSATPMGGCKTTTEPEKSNVLFKFGGLPTGDRFKWKWKGAATALPEMGDPINNFDDALVCVYDASASPQPVFTTVAPGSGTCALKPCWSVRGSTPGRRKLKYYDPGRRPDGLVKLEVKESLVDEAAIKARGQDQFIIMPALPLTPPVRVQLQAASGICWDATFSVPQDNDAAQFKARSD